MLMQGGWLRGAAPSNFVGLVADPFLGTPNMFNLYASPNNLSWMWINPTTGDLVYLQYWRADLNSELVHFFPQGIQNVRASAYDFQVFNCQLH